MNRAADVLLVTAVVEWEEKERKRSEKFKYIQKQWRRWRRWRWRKSRPKVDKNQKKILAAAVRRCMATIVHRFTSGWRSRCEMMIWEISIQFSGSQACGCGRRRRRLMFNKECVGFVEWKWRALADIKQRIPKFEQKANANERKTKCALINYRPAKIRLRVAQSRSDLRQYTRPHAHTRTQCMCAGYRQRRCAATSSHSFENWICKCEMNAQFVWPCRRRRRRRMRKFICVNFATARLTIIPFAFAFDASQFHARKNIGRRRHCAPSID